MTDPASAIPDDSAPNTAATDRAALARAVNDLQASEARVLRHAERVYEDTRSKLVLELLPVLDNLDRTLRAANDSRHPLVEGVRMVRSQLETVLAHYGLDRVDATGERFDPAKHEAVSTVMVEPGRVGMVIDQVEPGYRSGTRLLRAAQVTVGVLRAA